MKLCPLFESIQMPHKQRLEPPASFYDGLVAANRVLPREAIKYAIAGLEDDISHYTAMYGKDAPGHAHIRLLNRHIEQLRAMLPPSSPAA